MDDTNVVVLVARLTADPELRSTKGGTAVCSLRVAFNTSTKNAATNEWEDVGNFVNVTAWGTTGEQVAKYMHKGDRVCVNGRLQYRSWESEGQTRSVVEVVANRVQFLGSPASSQTSSPTSAPAESAPPPQTDDIPF